MDVRPGRPVAFSFQHHLVGAVAQPVDGGRPQDPVGEGIGPLRDVQVGGDDGAFALVALGDDIVEVLILGGLERFEPEVVDDQQIHAGQLGEVPVIAVDGPGGVELGEHLGGRW